jgi:hypothetical protein
MTKICSKCGIEKDIQEFDFRKDLGKYRNECKECTKIRTKIYYIRNKDKIKENLKKYYIENLDNIRQKSKERYTSSKDKILEKAKQYYIANKNSIDAYKKQYNIKNKDKVKEKQKQYKIKNKKRFDDRDKQYRVDNKDKIKCWFIKNKCSVRNRMKTYAKTKYKEDVNYRIRINLSSRIYMALKGKCTNKAKKTMALLGCDLYFLKKHLESQFTVGMSWENHGLYGWHIDHIRPCASFDLTDPEQQKQCFHYTNLQPLWAVENLRKGAKLLFAR